MKRQLLLLLAVLFIVISCKEKKEQEEAIAYASFGEKISPENVISKEEMRIYFSTMKAGDTLDLKFASTINEVCKKKGCWMKLNLGEEYESMVRFKDYGFFVPKDIDNREVVVEGKAYVTKISVDQLRHYAKDGGKSEEEISAITKPEITYAFEAKGVLLKE